MDVEINEKGDSTQYQKNVDNNDQTIIQNEDSISNDVNVDVITKKPQHVYAKRTKLSLTKGCEEMTGSSQGAGYASVGDKEKQICTVAMVQEGRVLDIEPINAVPIRYAEPTKDGIYKEKEKHIRELSEALCSPYVKRKLSWKFEEFKRKFKEAMAYTNLDKFDLTLEVDIIDNKKEENQDIVRRYEELPKKLGSDYAGANLDRKSTTGGYHFLAGDLFLGNAKRRQLWLTATFNKRRVRNPVFHSKTKHIAIRHHFIRDAYEKKLIQVLKIHTDDNVADLLTKAFDVSRESLGRALDGTEALLLPKLFILWLAKVSTDSAKLIPLGKDSTAIETLKKIPPRV
ncbi:hypothetical protein Tco_0054563 [Tanacetum coccineum]